MNWLEKIKNFKYIFKSIDDLESAHKELKFLSDQILKKRDELVEISGTTTDSEEERKIIKDKTDECVEELGKLYDRYDEVYPCMNYLVRKRVTKIGLDFMKEDFCYDRIISLKELTKAVSSLGVRHKTFPEDQAEVVYFEADEDFPDNLLVVIAIEGIWLKIQSYPFNCNITNEEQKMRFLDDSNNYNCQTRYFKTHMDSNGQVSIERQDFIESYKNTEDLANKLNFAVRTAYDFFKERKEFFKEVLETNPKQKSERSNNLLTNHTDENGHSTKLLTHE